MMDGEFFLGEFHPELHSEIEIMEMCGETIIFQSEDVLIYKDQDDHFFFRHKNKEDVSIEIILSEEDLTVNAFNPYTGLFENYASFRVHGKR